MEAKAAQTNRRPRLLYPANTNVKITDPPSFCITHDIFALGL